MKSLFLLIASLLVSTAVFATPEEVGKKLTVTPDILAAFNKLIEVGQTGKASVLSQNGIVLDYVHDLKVMKGVCDTGSTLNVFLITNKPQPILMFDMA